MPPTRTMGENGSIRGGAPKPGRRIGRKMLALLGGICLLPLIEGGLALAGIRPLAEDDLFVGFEGTLPLFVEEPGSGGRRFVLNPVKKGHFDSQPFENPKPPGMFRIVAVGGSTVYGHPYRSDTSFPRWTALLLGWVDPSVRYESVNAGGISYASYRDLRLLDELSRFSPDLFVAFSGHNEFLERRTFGRILDERDSLRRARALLHRSRLYSLLYRGVGRLGGRRTGDVQTVLGENVRAILEEVGGPELYHRDDAFRQGVLRQFRYDIESMVRLSRRKSIPLILCTLPSNLSGVSPFKSEHRDGLSDTDRTAWEQAFDAAKTALERDPREALRELARAEAIDDRYALLHYLKGRALREMGRPEEAYRAFDRAKEEDIVPLRALDAFNDTIREIARREGVPLADAEALFRRLSPGGIPGNNLFTDHVHPTLEGQQRIAWLVADTAVRAGITPVRPESWNALAPGLSSRLKEELASVPPRYRAMGDWATGRTYLWVGKPDEACKALERAWSEIHDVPGIPFMLGMIWLSRGDAVRAVHFLRVAAEMQPDDANTRYHLATAFLAQRKGAEAIAELDRIPEPRGLPAQVARVDAYLLLGRTREAGEEMKKALPLVQGNPGMRPKIADQLLRLGRQEEAMSLYPGGKGHPDPATEVPAR